LSRGIKKCYNIFMKRKYIYIYIKIREDLYKELKKRKFKNGKFIYEIIEDILTEYFYIRKPKN
jgi:hypothetical protein